jgi:HD superfamily phosphohydrolase
MAGLPKVVRDPVHNLITLAGDEGQLILQLVDQPEFQRLRRIRQLGLALLTFPGAEHSRWAHSFGVCHVARRMLDALRSQYGETSAEYKELSELRREIITAALLHDVGHGPFSHVFERAIPPSDEPPEDHPKDHESWSQWIIRERFGPILRKHGVRTDVVAGLVDKTNREHLLAKDFIDSQLDADRMDYLLRDSRAAGPKYGEFDLEWLLHSLRIGKVRVRGQEEGVLRLCFDSRKAIHVVEEYIQAREFMYVQVYMHKATRAYEALLKNILGLAAAIANGDPARVPQPCPPALAKMLAGQVVGTGEYLGLDDFRLWCALIDWSQMVTNRDARLERLRAKCERLVNRGKPYRVLELADSQRQDKALELVTELKSTGQAHSCVRDAFRDLAYRNVFYRKSVDDEEQEDRVIHFVEASGQTHAAEALSPVIDAISRIETKIYRLYYDETDAELTARLLKDDWVTGQPGERQATEEAS